MAHQNERANMLHIFHVSQVDLLDRTVASSLGVDYLLVQLLCFDYVVQYMNKNFASFSSTLVDSNLRVITSNLAAGTQNFPKCYEIRFSRHWRWNIVS